MDFISEIEKTRREVGEGRIPAGDGRAIRLERDYDTPIEDVWDAVTDPERISRWFLPVSGDLRLGGHYQLEGNAHGEIIACDPPERLRVTWVYGDAASEADVSEVEVRLSSTAEGGTRLVLEHTAIVPDDRWAEFGPGAVGVGWDMGILGLTLHLEGGSVGDPIAWQLAPEGRRFATRSSEAWGEANRAYGTDAEAAAHAVANTTAFYAPEPSEVPETDA
jgi:uncharacterized protein YndB with AHSA1/START domain